ncbi:MAG: phosphorylcholine transferase LicD [Erysipelotrichaceae bacterium]
MNQKNLKKLQEIELEIFDEFQKVCEQHKLTFYLFGGSCLGAIRHQGMIPWDDDIDLCMPRSDYEKLIKIASESLDQNYFLQHFENETNCGFVFGKIRRNNTVLSEEYSHQLKFHQGVWIDIFPCDNISDNTLIRSWDIWRFKFYQNIYIINCGYNFPNSKKKYLKPIFNIIKPVAKLFNRETLVKKLKYLMTRHNNKTTKAVFPYGGAYGKSDILERSIFENSIVVDFENRKAKVFENYDKYLTSIYNDYLQLPPLEQRNGGAHIIHEFKDER